MVRYLVPVTLKSLFFLSTRPPPGLLPVLSVYVYLQATTAHTFYYRDQKEEAVFKQTIWHLFNNTIKNQLFYPQTFATLTSKVSFQSGIIGLTVNTAHS